MAERELAMMGAWYAVSLGSCLWKARCPENARQAGPLGMWFGALWMGRLSLFFPLIQEEEGSQQLFSHSAYPGAPVRGRHDCPHFTGVDVEAWRGHSSTTVSQSGALEQGCLPATWAPDGGYILPMVSACRGLLRGHASCPPPVFGTQKQQREPRGSEVWVW